MERRLVMEGMTLLVILFLCVSVGLPLAVILSPLLQRLRAAERGRRQALEKLLLTIGVLTVPCWMLPALENRVSPHPSHGGWYWEGLLLGAPLWVMWQLLQRLVGDLFAVVGRVGLRPWKGEHGWGKPLKGAVGDLLLLVAIFLWLVFQVVLTAIAPARHLW
jgi:hypothetical protein